MIISHIVAASENNIIGVNNTLPWHIPTDLQYFKDKTRNHIVIMGRKTYESVLEALGKPLPNRLNIIITRQKNYRKEKNIPEEVLVVSSIEEAVLMAKENTTFSEKQWPEEVFICGGGQIYHDSLNITDRVYLTRVHRTINGDASYPNIPENFKQVFKQTHTEPEHFSFLVFEK